MDYQIVRYRPDFKRQIIRLQRHLWSRDPAVCAAHFEWKYERNPYLGPPFIHLAFFGDDLVGMRGMYGAQWQVGCPSEVMSAVCAGDLVIAPSHRERGLVAALMQRASEDLAELGYCYAFNLSAGLATQLASLQTGWRSIGTIAVARRRPRRRAIERRVRSWVARQPLIGRFARRPPARRPGPNERFAALDRHAAGSRPGSVAIESAPRPVEMAELVERIGHDGRVRQVRDETYFNWRFGNPLARYRFLFAGNARLEGYLVLHTRARRGPTEVAIVDWEAADVRTRAALLEAAIRWGEFDNLTIWPTMLSAEDRGMLWRSGFQPLDAPQTLGQALRRGVWRRTVLVRSIGHDGADEADPIVAGRRLLDPSNWDLRMIYSDEH